MASQHRPNPAANPDQATLARSPKFVLGPEGARPMPIDQPESASPSPGSAQVKEPVSEAYRQGRAERASLVGGSRARAARRQTVPPRASRISGRGGTLAHISGQDGKTAGVSGLGGVGHSRKTGQGKGQRANPAQPLARASSPSTESRTTLGTTRHRRSFESVAGQRERQWRHRSRATGMSYGDLGGTSRGGRAKATAPPNAAQAYIRPRPGVTNDYRVVLAAVLERHLHLDDSQLDAGVPHLPRPVKFERMMAA